MAKSTIVAPLKVPVKSTTVKASDAIKVSVTPKVKETKLDPVDPLKAIEKHNNAFKPLELSEGLGFNAQKVYTIHNSWAKNKPLIKHLAAGLTGKLKTDFAEFAAILDSINPNPGA